MRAGPLADLQSEYLKRLGPSISIKEVEERRPSLERDDDFVGSLGQTAEPELPRIVRSGLADRGAIRLEERHRQAARRQCRDLAHDGALDRVAPDPHRILPNYGDRHKCKRNRQEP